MTGHLRSESRNCQHHVVLSDPCDINEFFRLYLCGFIVFAYHSCEDFPVSDLFVATSIDCAAYKASTSTRF